MEEAAQRKLPVVVLDRPNPVGGFDDRGADARRVCSRASTGTSRCRSATALTLGELARLFNGEKKIGADLTVVAMKNWRRDDWFDDDGTAVGEPFAQHAKPERGDTLPGYWRDRIDEHLSRPRHRYAIRADRCALDQRARCRQAGVDAERAAARQASGSIPSRSRRRLVRSSAASRVRAFSRSSPTGIGFVRFASGWKSPLRCRGCTVRNSSWKTRRHCSARRRRWQESAPVTIRRRSRRPGMRTRRSGALCGQNTCSTSTFLAHQASHRHNNHVG